MSSMSISKRIVFSPRGTWASGVQVQQQTEKVCGLDLGGPSSPSIGFSVQLTYTFPLLKLFPCLLFKIETDGILVILLASNWARRMWYPDLLPEDSPRALLYHLDLLFVFLLHSCWL